MRHCTTNNWCGESPPVNQVDSWIYPERLLNFKLTRKILGPNCLSLSLGRGSTSTYFNTEHSSWFDCFLAKCRTRQCPWTAICKRSMGWPLEHPNYATLHNEQLVWGITTSKSSRQLPHVASIRRDCWISSFLSWNNFGGCVMVRSKPLLAIQ